MAPSPTARTRRLAAQLVASRGTSGASAAVPREFDVPPGSDDAEFAGHLRWMAQKMELGQDMLLLGPPGSLRRQLALRFCELQGHEAEVLTVTRDTTESDLKQRRELSRSTGSRTIYADSAPVRCALRGRVLVLDGLEKAERNVLPTLNNLLENREMQLDDGRLLIPARRYDVLSQQEISAEEGKAKLVRVHEDFRVVALAVPCPPWPGNPLDPPLRSRFQARIIMPPTLLSTTQLAPFFRLPAAVEPETLETLLRRLTALSRALETGQMPGGVRSPTLTYDAIFRLLRLVLSHSELRPSAGEAMLRAYPVGLLCGTKTAVRDATEQLLRHFDLAPEPRSLTVQPSRSDSVAGTVHLELRDGGAVGSLSLFSPSLPAASNDKAPFVAGAALQTLLARLVQDFASGSDCLLVGPAGCGKSALARHLAGLLGHGAPGGFGLEFFFLHEEMSSRDLLQRRATSDQGDTIWVDSPLVRAARSGAMCILDGAHRLKGDALCALAPLLQDRQACLSVAGDSQGAGWELLLRSDRFRAQGEKSFDAAAGCLVAAIHPSFKVLALAEPPTAQLPWLTEEVSACFATHSYPEQRPEDLADLLGTLVPSLPSASAKRFVDALSAAPSSAEGKEERLSVPLRVLLRVAKASAAEKGDEVELLHGLLQQQLFPFMPKGERSKLISQLSKHFPAATAELAAERALHRSTRSEDKGQAAAPPGFIRFGEHLAPVGAPKNPELVPSVDFVGIDRHMDLLEEISKVVFQRKERYLLLLGPQGVGKNRVVDYFLQSVRMEREYMQLHRDTTVSQLTVTPVVSDGLLYHEDSPLVRAAQLGRALVLDEADKAPLEVVVVLKSLIEDGQLALPDGRRLASSIEVGSERTIQVHPEFRMFVLANRPGFPFLGNDLLREADVFSVFCLDNPDAQSELQLARAIGPSVPEGILRTLVALFADLRLALEDGRLQYPYSARELLAVIRHLERFPNEPLEEALTSVLAFDRFDASLREALRPLLERRGVSSLAVLGPASGNASVAPTLGEPWLRALEALRRAKVAPARRLRKEPAGAWQVLKALEFHPAVFGSEGPEYHRVQQRPAMLDPPKVVPLADLFFERSSLSFDEGMVRAELPLSRRSDGVVDAVVGNGALHVLSTGPLCIWTIDDPQALGADAGRCSLLQVGPGADWSLAMASRESGRKGPPLTVLVNGRPLPLGQPQLAWIPAAEALLLHSPLDAMAPQLLLQRPSDPSGATARALHLPALQPRGAAAHRLRPSAEEGFVLVPHGWEPGYQSQPVDSNSGILDLTPSLNEGPRPHRPLGAAFTAMASLLFFQASSWRVVQLDVIREQTREVQIEHLLPAALRQQWQTATEFPIVVSATATSTLGVEMLLGVPQGRTASAQTFLSLFFPAGDPQAKPRARLVESHPRQSAAGGVLPMGLPGGPTAGITAVPFGSEASMTFAGDEVSARLPGATTVANLVEGQAQDGAKALWAYLAPNAVPETATPRTSWPSNEELTLAQEDQIKALVATPSQQLPSQRSRWRSKDVVCLGSELLLRAMSQGDGHDWLEFVHLPSRSARQLPASSEGMDASPVVRILAWPKPKLFQGDEAPDADAGTGHRGSCVVVFESGHLRWMEAHPKSLAQSLRDHFQRQGLRGVMEEELPAEDMEQEELEDLEDMELEELDELEDMELAEDEGEGGPMDHDPAEGPGGQAGQAGRASARRRGGRPTAGQPMARPGGRATGGPSSSSRPAGGRAAAGRAGGSSSSAAPGRSAAGAQPGSAGGAGAGRGGPQAVRRQLLRRALRQRRQAQKMRDLSGGGREEIGPDGKSPKEVSSPKHGDEDDKEHIGGNRWAGGTGGADTAGLGGRGGPYRLEKPGQRVRQVSDEAKKQVDAEAQAAARQLGQEALRRRLEEIHLSGGDYNFYSNLLSSVQGEIERLRAVLSGAAARQLERHWRRGQEGELDETRLVDALAGEANVFRRRKEREPRPGEPPMRPKRALFLFDASASMYRFNGSDGRLRRTCETAVMIMEALQGLETRFDYAVYCHDGDTPLQELVPFGQPPMDERGRLTVVSKLVASAQYCSSGDNTVEAIEQARQKVMEAGPADDRFVFAFSDANFERYGITGQALSKALSDSGRDEVRSILFLLATFEDEALLMAKSLPDQVRLCLDPRTLPSELRQEFASRVSRRSAL